MKKFLLLLSFTLFFYVNPIIIKDANAVVLLSDTPCSETGYKKPCNCLKESSWVKKRICNFRAGIKKGDFIRECADKSDGYSDAVAIEVYKDCMEEYGF